MTQEERSSIRHNLCIQRDRSRANRNLEWERLNQYAEGLKNASGIVSKALQDGKAESTEVPDFPSKTELELALKEFNLAVEKVRDLDIRLGKTESL